MVMEESSDDEQKEIEEIFDLIEMPDDLERFDDAGNIEELKISFQVNTPDINLDIGEKKKLEIIGDGEYEVRSKNTAMVRVVSSLEEAYEYNVLGLRSGNTSVVIKKIGTNETLRVPTKVNEPFEISAKRDIHLVIGDMEEVVTDSDIEILNRTTYVSILSNSIDNQKTRHVIHGTRVSTDGSVELVFRRKNRPEDVVVRSVYIYQGPTLISFPSKGIDRYVGQEAVINVLKIGSELTNKEVKWSIPDELKVIGEPSQGDRSSSIKLLCLAKCKDKISALIGPVNTVITANISKPDGSNFFKHGDYYFRLKQGASPILPLQLEHDVHIHTVNGIEYRDIFHNLKSSAMNFMGRSPENRKKARIIFLDLIVSWLETRKDNEFADPAVFEAVYSKFIEKRL
jgi:hypothetical protein